MRPAACLVLAFALIGCGDDDGPRTTSDGGGPGPDGSMPGPDAGRERAPLFRNPVDLEDRMLAFEALRLLGAPEAGATVGYCNNCHGLTRETIENWAMLTNNALSSCLTDLLVSTDESAAAMIACSQDGSGRYSASRLGIISTAADLEWFRYVFRHGAPDRAAWLAEHGTFVEQAGMPQQPGYVPMTQEQFDIVMEWFRRGIPQIGAVLGGDPPPGDCMPMVDPSVGERVTELQTIGWRARNAEAGILMYGCAGATTARDCLATEMLAADTTFGATWDVVPETFMRVLFTTTYRSSFWTRSSADGRFVGHGGGPGGSTIIDLERDVAIPAEASYDPAFFPDNSGFVFHGGGALFCEQSVLTAPGVSRVTFREAGCAAVDGVGLYEHIGTSLGGGDYWAVSGEFVSDDGGHGVTIGNPAASFSMGSTLTLTAMINTGTVFRTAASTGISMGWEGDTAITPSGSFLVSRAAGDAGQNGFILRRLDAMRSGTTITASAPVVGRYCINGGKPGFSYDERYMITHHYLSNTDEDAMELGFTGVADPGWAPYASAGAANVYLVDLTTGVQTRITNMGPGQYALFPHFRSDGWIYFIVRQGGAAGEHVVASDVALMME